MTKEEYLNKSNAILISLKSTIESFYTLYNSLDDDKENQKQDLLRAIILFSCSGIDSIVKQLVNDTLDYVIEHDEGAFNQFKNYTEKKLILKNEAGINSKLFAELFTCGNPKQTLIDVLKKDLTSNSLQSADELLKVGSVFNIETANLVNGKEEHEKLRSVFIVRNQITHEMDVDMTASDFKMRDRTYEEINDYSEFIIKFIEKFIELISEKLDDTSEVDEFEQIVSL